jgi:hypothetical protein
MNSLESLELENAHVHQIPQIIAKLPKEFGKQEVTKEEKRLQVAILIVIVNFCRDGGHEVSQVANCCRDRVHMVLADEIELVKVKSFDYEAARKEKIFRHQWCFDLGKQSYSVEYVKLNRSLISWATHHFKLLKYLVGLRHRWR